MIIAQKEISIIIPTLNEEKNIRKCLGNVAEVPNAEIIVSDGGSTDRTIEIVKLHKKVKVVSSPTGRGVQMNTGALYAHGEILLFLHADCILPTNVLLNIRHIFENNHVVGGAFNKIIIQ